MTQEAGTPRLPSQLMSTIGLGGGGFSWLGF